MSLLERIQRVNATGDAQAGSTPPIAPGGTAPSAPAAGPPTAPLLGRRPDQPDSGDRRHDGQDERAADAQLSHGRATSRPWREALARPWGAAQAVLGAAVAGGGSVPAARAAGRLWVRAPHSWATGVARLASHASSCANSVRTANPVPAVGRN